MTIQNLASVITKGFERQDKNLEKLAEMVANGFSHMEEKMDDMVTKEEFNTFKKKVATRFDSVDESLEKIRADMLKLGDRFVSRFEFETLVSRFNALESERKTKAK